MIALRKTPLFLCNPEMNFNFFDFLIESAPLLQVGGFNKFIYVYKAAGSINTWLSAVLTF